MSVEHEDKKRYEDLMKKNDGTTFEEKIINKYERERFSKSKFLFSRKTERKRQVALRRFEIRFDAMSMEEKERLDKDKYPICEVVVISLINFAVLRQTLSERK